jgi:enoyl-CoA hydratase/carnithine racemase
VVDLQGKDLKCAKIKEMIDAKTAEAWRLVTKVVPHDDLRTEALALAHRIAEQPPHALRLAKNLLRNGTTASYDTMMDMSAAAQAIAHLTDDHMEGVDALLEGRPAVFKGS